VIKLKSVMCEEPLNPCALKHCRTVLQFACGMHPPRRPGRSGGEGEIHF